MSAEAGMGDQLSSSPAMDNQPFPYTAQHADHYSQPSEVTSHTAAAHPRLIPHEDGQGVKSASDSTQLTFNVHAEHEKGRHASQQAAASLLPASQTHLDPQHWVNPGLPMSSLMQHQMQPSGRGQLVWSDGVCYEMEAPSLPFPTDAIGMPLGVQAEATQEAADHQGHALPADLAAGGGAASEPFMGPPMQAEQGQLQGAMPTEATPQLGGLQGAQAYRDPRLMLQEALQGVPSMGSGSETMGTGSPRSSLKRPASDSSLTPDYKGITTRRQKAARETRHHQCQAQVFQQLPQQLLQQEPAASAAPGYMASDAQGAPPSSGLPGFSSQRDHLSFLAAIAAQYPSPRVTSAMGSASGSEPMAGVQLLPTELSQPTPAQNSLLPVAFMPQQLPQQLHPHLPFQPAAYQVRSKSHLSPWAIHEMCLQSYAWQLLCCKRVEKGMYPAIVPSAHPWPWALHLVVQPDVTRVHGLQGPEEAGQVFPIHQLWVSHAHLLNSAHLVKGLCCCGSRTLITTSEMTFQHTTSSSYYCCACLQLPLIPAAEGGLPPGEFLSQGGMVPNHQLGLMHALQPYPHMAQQGSQLQQFTQAAAVPASLQQQLQQMAQLQQDGYPLQTDRPLQQQQQQQPSEGQQPDAPTDGLPLPAEPTSVGPPTQGAPSEGVPPPADAPDAVDQADGADAAPGADGQPSAGGKSSKRQGRSSM